MSVHLPSADWAPAALSSTPRGRPFGAGPTWFLPPELGNCDRGTLDAVFDPGGGHVVNIIGFQIFGLPSSPDPFRSYFILQNNWGKNSGYRSFYFMNFAAFKYLASDLILFRLDRSCWSNACARQPVQIFPRYLLKPLLYPPEPGGPLERRYQQAIREVRPQLGGVARQPEGISGNPVHR
jgi:hypothetical protein